MLGQINFYIVMANKKQIQLGYKITKIQTTKFSFTDIEENKLIKLTNDPKGLGININVSLNIDIKTTTINMDVQTKLFVTESKEPLVEHTGRTVYFIEGLEKIYNKEADAYDFPDALLIQLYGIAYTHSRALLAIEISPTCYRDKYFLPVINPADLLQKKK